MPRVDEVVVRALRMPLREPYPSAIATIDSLDALVVQVRTSDGAAGFGEAVIVEGYTHETQAGGWQFCIEHAKTAIGREPGEVKAALTAHRGEHSHAVSTLTAAIEMAEGHVLLAPPAHEARVPLLAPVNAKHDDAITAEVERLLSEGFGTLKVKVGFEVHADIRRVRFIQGRVGGRALIRLDGNQGYSQADAETFVRALDPTGIELFEQPCADHDWSAAAALARIAPVPMMLDESIYASADIARAAKLNAARYIKLKLAKAGGLDALAGDLRLITQHGMRRVLGNGVATEIACWMEGCVARELIDNAGEMNGYLKPADRLFREPLPFSNGAMVIPRGYRPALDEKALTRLTVRTERFAQVAAAAQPRTVQHTTTR